jgi:hypothetical protein
MSDFARSSVRSVPDALLARGRTPSANALASEEHAPNVSSATPSNQAVQRLLRGVVQAKLEVNEPDDDFEREADAAAAAVMRMPDGAASASGATSAPPRVQRMTATAMDSLQRQQAGLDVHEDEKRRLRKERDEAEKKVKVRGDAHDQTKERHKRKGEDEAATVRTKRKSSAVPPLTASAEQQIEQSRGGGAALDSSTREFFEHRFGRDLGHVRVHNDAQAAQTARDLSAHAFTTSRDIYFGAGRYEPTTARGRSLLAHEIAHTLQQAPGPAVSTPRAASAERSPSLPSPARTPRRAARTIARQAAGTPASPPVAADGTKERDAAPEMPLEEVPLDKSAEFAVSPTIAEWTKGKRNAPVRVKFGKLAAGTIKVTEHKGVYEAQPQAIELNHPVFEPVKAAGLQTVLVVHVHKNVIGGYVSIAGKKGIPKPTALIEWIEQNTAAMGWVGLEGLKLPKPKNELADGTLTLEVPEFPFKLGGYFAGKGKFGVTNDVVTFSASALIKVPGVTDAQIDVERAADGKLFGHVDVPVSFRNFSGNLKGDFGNGTVSVEGRVGIQTEKMSGQVTLLVTDAETARNVAKQLLPPEAIKASQAETDAKPKGGKGPKPGPRALAGWGTIDAHVTEWLTGTAQVIIDNEGHITVSGTIAPPAEIKLFDQRNYHEPILDAEVRAVYGVPLVGDAFFFASLGLAADAKLGPGKITNIVIEGRYSTDPEILQEFSISGSVNISAYAGLTLTAKGGVGVEIVRHTVKVGVAISAGAGIEGYVEATPKIQYLEVADPELGKKGEARLKGHLEVAARPIITLGGELFVDLSTPWWSPVSDHHWGWPLGELEYPLPGEFGIGADIDYLLGSKELPDLKLGKVDFSADKFMTDMMDDKVPPKQTPSERKKGSWKEAEPAVPVPVNAPPEPAAQAKAQTPKAGKDGKAAPGKKLPTDKSGRPVSADVPKPELKERWLAGIKAINELAEPSHTNPFDPVEINQALAGLKREYGFTELRAKPEGNHWLIHASMNPFTDLHTGILAEFAERQERAPGRQAETVEAMSAQGAQVRGRTAHPVHDHHLLPQSLADASNRWQVADGSINVDLYTITIDEGTHLSVVHSMQGWLPIWNAFLRANPNPTKLQVYNQLMTMIVRFDLGAFEVHAYRDRERRTQLGWIRR